MPVYKEPSGWIFHSIMAIGDVLRTFADHTTMHGVPKLIQARSIFGRIFWTLVCLAAGGMFCVNMSELLHRYFSYPKKVTVEVVPTAVPFPAITICNMRNLDIHILNTLNRMFINDSEPRNHINTSAHPFIKVYMKSVARYGPVFYAFQKEHQAMFQEIFSRTTFSANIPRDIIKTAAVSLDELIVHCHYASRRCNVTRDFLRFFDPYYFNCFTYNAPNALENDDSMSEGIENGWSSVVMSGTGMLDKNTEPRMLPGINEYRSAVASSEGVRVVIHPPNTEPFPFTEGYDVPPGFSASFGIRPRRNIRIGPPHGNCSQDNPFGDGSQRYRLMACQKMCMQSFVIKYCNCSDVSLPTLPNKDVPLCRNDSGLPDRCMYNATKDCLDNLLNLHKRIKCAKGVRGKFGKNATALQACKCFPPCDEVAYDVSYSLSKWPAEGYEGDAAYYDIIFIEKFAQRFKGEKSKLLTDYFNLENRYDHMKAFSRLNVYIADSNAVKTAESEDYTRNQLVSDIGGQLGLWVGISIITLAEMLELVVEIVKYLSSSYKTVPKHDTYSNGRQMTEPPTRPKVLNQRQLEKLDDSLMTKI